MEYEPTIKDRVRIALALTIVENKDQQEDIETCILRFRDKFPQPGSYHHDRCNRSLPSRARRNDHNDVHEDPNEMERSDCQWQAKIKSVRVEIDSLTKQLAERDADISVLHADLEAVQPISRPPPKKKQNKSTGTDLGQDASMEVTMADSATNLNVKKKSGRGPGIKKEGQSQAQGEAEGVIQMLSRKLDEVLDQATNGIDSTNRTAGLLTKLFDAPMDIGHEFLPLRLEAIFLHAQDLVHTCSIYLEASIEATLHPSTASVKRSISSRVRHPGRLVQMITLLLQALLPALSRSIEAITSEIGAQPGFDHDQLERRYSDLIVLIGKEMIFPAIKAIRKSSDKVFSEQQRRSQVERRTRFMHSSMAQSETERRDIREGLVKFLLTLSRCKMKMEAITPLSSSKGPSGHPLAEIIAFGSTIELVEILKPEPNARSTLRPTDGHRTTSVRPETSADQETVQVLLMVLRAAIPDLPCCTSANLIAGQTRSSRLLEAILKRGPEETSAERQSAAACPPADLLLGMTIRSQLVQLLSPIVQPITSALYDCFSPHKSPPQEMSVLLNDRACRDALMQVAEELMLAEGQEQGGIGDWVTDQITALGDIRLDETTEELQGQGNANRMNDFVALNQAQSGLAGSQAGANLRVDPPASPQLLACTFPSNETDNSAVLKVSVEKSFMNPHRLDGSSVFRNPTDIPLGSTQYTPDKPSDLPLVELSSAIDLPRVLSLSNPAPISNPPAKDSFRTSEFPSSQDASNSHLPNGVEFQSGLPRLPESTGLSVTPNEQPHSNGPLSERQAISQPSTLNKGPAENMQIPTRAASQ